MATVPAPKRGEIWLVDFDPAVGSEIRKIRPALVVSLDAVGRLPCDKLFPLLIGNRSMFPTLGLRLLQQTLRMD